MAAPFEVRASQASLFSILVEALISSLMPGQTARFVPAAERDQLRSTDVLLTHGLNGRTLVVFGAAPDGALVARHLDAGTHSMISVDASREELVAAIESLVEGPSFVSAGVVAALARAPRAVPDASLTAREREIVRLVVEGLSNGEIASRLCVSPNTVRTHLQGASAKLGVSGRTRIAAKARSLGIA
jgi:DNA-binding NarL/FixJ family response regulator